MTLIRTFGWSVLGALTLASSVCRAQEQVTLLGPALTYHQQRTHAGRAYQEFNPGLGISVSAPLEAHPDWRNTESVSLLRDSFGVPSLFFDAALTRHLWHGETLALQGGGFGGMAYKAMRWDSARQWVAYAGPTLVLGQVGPQGAELRGSYVYHRNASTGRLNGVFSLQTGYRF